MGVISKGGIRGEKKGPVVLASTVMCILSFSGKTFVLKKLLIISWPSFRVCAYHFTFFNINNDN